MAADNHPTVDPAVSRRKFERELADYRKMEKAQQQRGWWMLEAEFPRVFVVFAANIKPPAVVFGAELDFTNYDLEPPSIRLVDPFTRVPYLHGQAPVPLAQAIPRGNGPSSLAFEQRSLLAGYGGEPAFVCLQGVREYHRHPAHSGDSWMLQRKTGKGTLWSLLDVLYRYGVQPIVAYQVEIHPRIVGFVQGSIPT